MHHSIGTLASGLFVSLTTCTVLAADFDAYALAKKTFASHGGADELLRTFKFMEVYLLAGKDKGTERTSTLQPTNLWYVGNTERVSEQNKGSVCHDVWMWTLAPLVDPKANWNHRPMPAWKAERPTVKSQHQYRTNHEWVL